MKPLAPSRLILAALAAMCGSALGSFHLFSIQEVFSNGDGTVQFIELYTNDGGQQFLDGHSVSFELNGVATNSVTLSELPGDTTNKTFLIGTANLATLFGVTPDFVISANFFSPGSNNFINFAGGTDRVNLTLLPTNGVSSLNGMIHNSGSTSAATSVNATATLTNFAGSTATVPELCTPLLAALGLGSTLIRRRRH